MPNLEDGSHLGYLPYEQKYGAPNNGLDVLAALGENMDLSPGTLKGISIIKKFGDVLSEIQDKLPSDIELKRYMQMTTSLGSLFLYGDDRAHNGDFNFGEDIESFYVSVTAMYSFLGISEYVALNRLRHEFDHFAVFRRYKIPVEFHLFMGVAEGTEHLVDAMAIRPLFPAGMPKEQILRIAQEATKAPTDLSDSDLNFLSGNLPG